MADPILPRGAFQHLRHAHPVSDYTLTSKHCGEVEISIYPMFRTEPACAPRDAVRVHVRPIKAAVPEWYSAVARRQAVGQGPPRNAWESGICAPKGLRADTRSGRAEMADRALVAYEKSACGMRTYEGALLNGHGRKRRKK